MKPRILLPLASLLVLGSCRKKETAPPAMPETTFSELPGPQRAAVAAARVLPELKSAAAARSLHVGDPIFIRAFKEEDVLELFIRDRDSGRFVLFRSYPVAAASGTLGPKLAEGDRQVPEGFYFVPPAAMKPDSQFHLAFNIGFPNDYDRAHSRSGSAIMVHGNQVSIGCLAMTDAKVEEIYTLCDAALSGGQPFFRVAIFPFRMTSERMTQAAGNPNLPFWQILKQGYDAFEKTEIPPKVTVADRSYVFEDGD